MKFTLTKTIFCILTVLSSLNTFAQSSKSNSNSGDYSKFHLGLGIGMDYGGLGFKAEYLPVKYIGLFGGVGFNFGKSPGLNAGLHFRPLSDAKFEPFVLAMYGYNAVLKIKNYGYEDVNKTYYGFTTGIGGELKLGRKKNRLYFSLLLPFRSQEFKDNYDRIKNDPYVKIDTPILPIGYSIGFNWTI